MGGPHHINKRKRIHLKKEKYPHPNKWVRWLDNFLLVIAVLGPLVTLPQIIRIFLYKNADGLSIITWGFFALGSIPWVAYGIVHKEKPIVVSYSLWFILYLATVIGILVYG